MYIYVHMECGMKTQSCFGCTKHNELVSLQAAVNRFQDGTEFRNLSEERDRAVRKYERCDKQRQVLAEENSQLRMKNRSLTSSEQIAQSRYERLLYDYEILMDSYEEQNAIQSEECFERIEHVINSLNKAIARYIEQQREDRALIQKLRAQITQDSTNSSIPSSRLPNHKTPPNNREKTGRKPGAQKGHTGHTRKRLEPTEEIHHLPPPEEVINNPDYYKTGKTIVKQLISLSLKLEVIQYEADEYRHRKTRRKIHAAFPEGMINEVEYDALFNAFVSLLHSHGNMSYDKIIEILSDLTGGKLKPSKGMLASLEKKFSGKSAEDRQKIFNRMLVYPYMHIDGTAVRVNGKNGQVLIETSPVGTLLYHTGVKGDESVKGTPAENYDGTSIHDGEAAFFHYGKKHQICMIHESRYTKGSMDNEPHLTWASEMRELIQNMMHYVNEAKRQGRTELMPSEIQLFEDQFDAILELAEKEYRLHPPNMKYYSKGINTMKRLKKRKEACLLFLHDLSIPCQNNPAELIARKEKMHSKQSGGYRSAEYSQYHCDVLSVIESNKTMGISRYDTLLGVFKRR